MLYQFINPSTEQSAIIAGSGHWVAEQTPEQLLETLMPFLAPYQTAGR